MKKLFQIGPVSDREIVRPVLCLALSESHLTFAIVDEEFNLLKSLYAYSFENNIAGQLPQLSAKHPELSNPYYKIFISYHFPQHVLLPVESNLKGRADEILDIIHGKHENMYTFNDHFTNTIFQNSYRLPIKVHDWVKSNFKNLVFRQQYSSLIKCLPKDDKTGSLFVDFSHEDFVIGVSKNNELLLLQGYSYSTPEDVLFYLLKACQQFSLSPQEVQLQLSGLIEKNSALFRELYQYFINTSFRNAQWDIPESEYPPHFFTMLNDLAICG